MIESQIGARESAYMTRRHLATFQAFLLERGGKVEKIVAMTLFMLLGLRGYLAPMREPIPSPSLGDTKTTWTWVIVSPSPVLAVEL